MLREFAAAEGREAAFSSDSTRLSFRVAFVFARILSRLYVPMSRCFYSRLYVCLYLDGEAKFNHAFFLFIEESWSVGCRLNRRN